MPWIAAYTEPNHELALCQWLCHQRQEALVPCFKKTIHRRRSKAPDVIMRPAFPCYVFIRLPVDYTILRRGPGYRYTVSALNDPIYMDDNNIDNMCSMAENGEFDNLNIGSTLTFTLGEMVLVVGSAMDGKRGRVLRLPHNEYGTAMIELGNHKVLVPVGNLGRP